MKYINHGGVKNGKFVPDHPRYLIDGFKSLEGKRITVTIGKFRKPRSDKENRYYHGIPVKMIADYIGEENKRQVHEYLKVLFLTTIEYKQIGNTNKTLKFTRTKSTTELSTVEFEEYLDSIRRWAAQFLGIEIPTPNEVIP